MIPSPKKIEVNRSVVYTVPYAIFTEREEWGVHALAFQDSFFKGHAKVLAQGVRGGIELCYDASLAENAYRLQVKEAIRVFASAREGLLYGLASVLQLGAVKNEGIVISEMEIEDYPDKDYRSIMVDIGREWHPFGKLLKFVDICFFYKIKYLNLHFADNKLYTLPSKAFPKLNVEGKYYKPEEIAYLCEYAEARGVVLVPEFECPGHAPVLNTYYPEVFMDEGVGEGGLFYNESGAVIDNKALLCAGSEKAVEGVKTLLKEMCELFPNASYIHIGGDEANVSLWKQCVHCRKYMEENGIDGVLGLYSDYVARITRHVLSLGRTPIVWEGFPEKGADKIPPETVVISWENHYQTTHQLLAEGFKLINASWKPLYIIPKSIMPDPEVNWGAKEIYDWSVYNWQHFWVNSVARLNPINIQPTDQVLGGMLCAWEMTFEQEITLIMANLPALAERTWSVNRVRSFEEFRGAFQDVYNLCARIIQDR